MQIRPDDPSRPALLALLREHHADMLRHSPPDSVHALDEDALHRGGVDFFSAWIDDRLAGCAALKELDPRHGEIKSMRTARPFLRRGVAAALLSHLVAEARRRGYARLSLETGSMDAFAPARALYARHGFVACPPFADYVEDPYSVFMTRTMEPPGP
jgi:putative acetyltransferase